MLLLIVFGFLLTCFDFTSSIGSESDSDVYTLPRSFRSPDDLKTPDWLQDIPTEKKVRKYRALRTTYSLLIGILFQIPGTDFFGLPANLNLKSSFQFVFPTLGTKIDNFVGRSSTALPFFNRTRLFNDVENFIQSFGYDGKNCLLRSICELGALPFDHGILGEALNFLLLGTVDGELIEDNSIDPEYCKARKIADGDNKENCADKYPMCKISLLDFMSGNKFY